MNNFDMIQIQKGKSDFQYNNKTDWQNYSALENYILAKSKIKQRLIIDSENYNNVIDSATKDIISALQNCFK